jgi:sulfate permease, SulP family
VNATRTTKQKAGGRWRLPLFQSVFPLDRSGLVANLAAGISLAAMNIPQAMGYAKIAGTPVITGLYTLLLPLVAFAALGSSRYLVVASDSATAAILAGGLAGVATAGSAHYVSLAGLVALLTAGFLLLARLLKLGFLADFLSRTVLTTEEQKESAASWGLTARFGSITPRPTPAGLTRSKSGFPRLSVM